MSDRRAQFRSQQHRKRIGRALQGIEAVDFFNVLTSPELLEKTEAHLPEHRERLYPPTVTLALFMRQALNEDGSCQKAVNGWAAQRVAEGLKPNGVDTGAYCRARQRLPVEMVRALTRESGRLLCTKALPGWLWRGRTVKLMDGSTISMPNTPQNTHEPTTRHPSPPTLSARADLIVTRDLDLLDLKTYQGHPDPRRG